jgi:3-oxoadipate enol-lactonase
MPIENLKDINLHFREDGDPDGAPIVFANSLGTDLRLWDNIIDKLPDGLRIIRYDMRGHGQSDCPNGPYSMGTLVRDAEQLLDMLGVNGALFVGLSIGGMVAQGLAVKRLDLIRAIVLSNTAAKIGQPGMWQDRITMAREGGVSALTEATMDRWFPKPFHASDEFPNWVAMFESTPLEGFTGCMAAISGTDFYTPTSGLRLPAIAIAGSEDKSTPPDLVRETIDLIPGSKFHLIRRAGHVPCVDQPEAFAKILNDFIAETGHLA